MNHVVLDAFTRRASLMTLGTAGLAALISPVASVAKKNRRKRQRKKGDVFKLCKKQVGQCLDFLLPICGDDLECRALIETCCPEMGQRDFTGFIVSLDNAGATVDLPGPLFRRP